MSYGFEVATSGTCRRRAGLALALALCSSSDSSRALQRGDQVALEKVGASGKGDGVGDRAFEVGGRGGKEVQRFGDGGGVGVREEEDEGFDGCDRHGEFGIGA